METPVAAAEKPRVSPLVRALAEERHVDLEQVRGTGSGGRVTRDDVLAYDAGRAASRGPGSEEAVGEPGAKDMAPPDRPGAEQAAPLSSGQEAPAPAPAPVAGAQRVTPPQVSPTAILWEEPVPAPSSQAVQPTAPSGDQIVPLTNMRRQIAEHMARSRRTAPHAAMMVEVDMTGLVRFRGRAKDEFQRNEGVGLTYLPFMIKACVAALRAHPVVNASWADDGIVAKRAINIGIAIALENGLIVPVIHDADGLSIAVWPARRTIWPRAPVRASCASKTCKAVRSR